MPRLSKRRLLEHLGALAVALVLVFALRSSVIEAFKIPSGSMIPTILVGDHVLVNKLAYEVRWPFSGWFGWEPAWRRGAPARGEIVVFRYPKDESVHYVKRVVGVPGDWIRIRGRTLSINDRPVPLDKVDGAGEFFEKIDDPLIAPEEFEFKREDLDGHKHLVLHDKNSFVGENFGPVAVPPEHLFVMGDNRDLSNDSRFWGFVPYRNVEGRATRIALSFAIGLDPLRFEFRPERTFRALE